MVNALRQLERKHRQDVDKKAKEMMYEYFDKELFGWGTNNEIAKRIFQNEIEELKKENKKTIESLNLQITNKENENKRLRQMQVDLVSQYKKYIEELNKKNEVLNQGKDKEIEILKQRIRKIEILSSLKQK